MRNRGLTFILGLLVTLALIEVFLQVAEIQSPLETTIDPEIGPTYRQNREFTRFSEGFYVGGTNAWRGLGEGRPPVNESDELRVVLLGDSSPLGHTVFDRHHFARTIEKELTAATGRSAVVLNFGRADFQLPNAYRYWCDYVSRWDCDLVLVFVDSGDLLPVHQIGKELYPTTVLDDDGDLSADLSFRDRRSFRLATIMTPMLSTFATPRMLFNAYKAAKVGRLQRMALDKFAPKRSGNGPAAPWPPRAMSPVCKRIVAELARDPRMVLVFKEGMPRAYADVADSCGLPCVDLVESLLDLERRGIDPVYWPVTRIRGHWNHAAHAAIGPYLADQIITRFLPGMLRAPVPATATAAVPVAGDPRPR